MQETRVWPLVSEDSTCLEAAKLEHHNLSLYSRAQEPQLLSLHMGITEARVP